MNRILTNEPSGSKELAVEFNLIDPNANALENALSDIETEASHSKYENQHSAALAMLRTQQTKAAEVHETCRKAVRDIHAATGPEAYRRAEYQTKLQPLQLTRLVPGEALYDFLHQIKELQKNQPIFRSELQGTLQDRIIETIRA